MPGDTFASPLLGITVGLVATRVGLGGGMATAAAAAAAAAAADNTMAGADAGF